VPLFSGLPFYLDDVKVLGSLGHRFSARINPRTLACEENCVFFCRFSAEEGATSFQKSKIIVIARPVHSQKIGGALLFRRLLRAGGGALVQGTCTYMGVYFIFGGLLTNGFFKQRSYTN